MIWLGVILGLFVLAYRLGLGRWMKEAPITGTLLVGFTAFFLFFTTNVIVAEVVEPKYAGTGKTAIVSLDAAAQVQGTFVLGSGQINSEPYYFYYIAQKDGGYKLGQTPADEVVIYEEGRETGTVLEFSPTFVSLLWSVKFPARVEIHVPKGTIIQEFNANIGRS